VLKGLSFILFFICILQTCFVKLQLVELSMHLSFKHTRQIPAYSHSHSTNSPHVHSETSESKKTTTDGHNHHSDIHITSATLSALEANTFPLSHLISTAHLPSQFHHLQFFSSNYFTDLLKPPIA